MWTQLEIFRQDVIGMEGKNIIDSVDPVDLEYEK